MTRSEAKRIREILEEAVQSLDDATAEEVIMFFPIVDENTTELVKGKRYRHNGKLKKAKKNYKAQANGHYKFEDNDDFWEHDNRH